MENELEHLRTELGRAYRALLAYTHAHASGKRLNEAAVCYHSLTEAAAMRFVNEGALDGSEYFIGKSVDVLHAALRGADWTPAEVYRLRAERDALQARIDGAPKGECTGFDSAAAWMVSKDNPTQIYAPLRHKRVALVVVE